MTACRSVLPGHVYLQRFHGYVQRDTKSSHLLHKAHSMGTVQGTQGAMDKEDTNCTLSSNTPVLPPTEKGWRQRGGWDEKGKRRQKQREEGGLGIYTHIQIQKNMYKSYSLQALCSHIYSHRNRQQNHSMEGSSIWDMQVTRACCEKTKVWDKNQSSLRGWE